MQPELGDEQVVDVEGPGGAVGLPAGRGEERAQHGVGLEGPRDGGVEAVLAPPIGARGEQPAAVAAALLAGFD